MTAEIVRIPRKRVFRLVKRLGLERQDGLGEIDHEMRQIDQAIKTLNARKAELVSAYRARLQAILAGGG
jgi:hypothetical protein